MSAVPSLVLDTNCLIYFLDAPESPRGEWLAQHVFRRGMAGELSLRVATVSLAELLVRPFATGEPERAHAVRRALTQLPGLTLIPLDVDLATHAASLRGRDGIQPADAVVLATAHAAQSRLLTNDRRLQAANPDVVVLDDAMQQPDWS